MKIRTLRTLSALAIVALLSASVRAAEPAVLAEIPDDVSAALVIPNVKTASTHIANLGTRLSLPVPPDPVGAVLRKLRITKGFDPAGSAALVILKPLEKKADDANEEPLPPPFLLVLPTTDAKALLEPFTPADADKEGISEVTMPDSPTDIGYAATVGKFVVLAQQRDVLARFLIKKQGLNKTLGADALKAYDTSDFVLYANIPSMAKAGLEALEKKQQETIGMMEMVDANSVGNDIASAMRHFQVNQAFSAFKSVLSDANTGLVTVKISDAGVSLGLVGQFKSDSPSGKFLLAQKAVQPPTLVGLPTGSIAAAGAMAWDSKSMTAQFVERFDLFLKEPALAKLPKLPEYKKALDQYGQTFALTKSVNFVLFETPAAGKKGWLNGAAVIDTTDSAAYLKLVDQLLAGPLGTETGDADIISAVKITKDAVTQDGVKLMKVVKTFSLREETADNPVSQTAKHTMTAMQSMYGEGGVVTYLGAIGNKVIMIVGSDGKTLTSAIEAVKKNSDALALDAKIKGVEKQLAPNSLATMYVSLDKWLPLLEAVVFKTLGLPEAPPAPEEAAEPAATAPQPSKPMVISVGVTGPTLTVETHMPTSSILDIIKWGNNLQERFRGGM